MVCYLETAEKRNIAIRKPMIPMLQHGLNTMETNQTMKTNLPSLVDF